MKRGIGLSGAAWTIGASLFVLAGVGTGGVGDGSPIWLDVVGKSVSITATEVTAAQFQSCVDAGSCEATHFDDCNLGDASRSDHPVNCVDYYAAEQYCAFAGGRICSESEWLAACAGGEGRAYPYGSTYEIDTCNMQSLGNPIADREKATAAVGSNATCVGGLEGLYDMAGNVWEWVDECKDDYCKFRGGAFLTDDPIDLYAACGSACSGNDKSFKNAAIGIRCCRDDAP
jgi:sulfatase modifying factor 1